ncbi:hypothetical protein [Klebsiella pneumoniae]|uniref:hypothetical protein n=1 Tax=Klebsiella pneumoniae TaxID=573 RepID=UPI001CF25049|nr:hypothetical protein [Klebsiella pneumoniae]MCB3185920.1 hypothetical protein [Klebsiella pneumoniae]MCY0682454.1 hypothetical protein [Klebsiella pneumoniae]UGQ70681.1 hypothetical protein LRZ78_27765 [Klebsiella pneumoniae]UGR13910.1 hypothetical protein LRZ76_27765 [Klebsiella pneumoniae]
MSTFIAAVFTVILTLIAIGKFVWAVVVAYRSLTWFLTHFDELPYIWTCSWRYYRRYIFRRIYRRVFSR